jgi:hypothetical protein
MLVAPQIGIAPLLLGSQFRQADCPTRHHKCRLDYPLGGVIRRAYSSRHSGACFKD